MWKSSNNLKSIPSQSVYSGPLWTATILNGKCQRVEFLLDMVGHGYENQKLADCLNETETGHGKLGVV